MKSARELLLGRWRSDKRQTLKGFHRYHQLSLAQKRRLGSLFGRLEIQWTSECYYTCLDGTSTKCQYEVIAEDAHSVVVRSGDDSLRKIAVRLLPRDEQEESLQPELCHIQFEVVRGRQYYWIGMGRYCEWFQRVPPQ